MIHTPPRPPRWRYAAVVAFGIFNWVRRGGPGSGGDHGATMVAFGEQAGLAGLATLVGIVGVCITWYAMRRGSVALYRTRHVVLPILLLFDLMLIPTGYWVEAIRFPAFHYLLAIPLLAMTFYVIFAPKMFGGSIGDTSIRPH